MKYCLIALATLGLLTACSTPVFDARGLPDIKAYSPQEQKQAAQELRTAKCDPRINPPKDCTIPAIKEFLKDYKVMRDQTRAAKGKQ